MPGPLALETSLLKTSCGRFWLFPSLLVNGLGIVLGVVVVGVLVISLLTLYLVLTAPFALFYFSTFNASFITSCKEKYG